MRRGITVNQKKKEEEEEEEEEGEAKSNYMINKH